MTQTLMRHVQAALGVLVDTHDWSWSVWSLLLPLVGQGCGLEFDLTALIANEEARLEAAPQCR